MKKVLSAFWAALIAAGSAAHAEAASRIDISGYYRIMYMSETNTGYGREPRSFTDSYFQDRLNLEVTFNPTDEISVFWRLRGPGSYKRWGSGYTNLETHFIYGQIKQDWGSVLVGRLSDDLDVYGLASLGYQPASVPVYTNVGPFDRADVLDGIRYSHGWDNGISLMAQYGKIDNNGQTGGPITKVDNSHSPKPGYGPTYYVDGRNESIDQDWDRYQLEVTYAWNGGGVGLGLLYDRDATSNARKAAKLLGEFGWMDFYDADAYDTKDGKYYPHGFLDKTESWGLNPAIMHSWGDFSIHFEGMAQWTKRHYIAARLSKPDDQYSIIGSRNFTAHAKGFGAYLDLDYNYGSGNATLAAWWVSGSDLSDDESRSEADIVGGNFYPLLVAYNGVNLNPGGNRHFGNAGNKVSAVGFANNAFENYVAGGHLANTFLNQAVFSGASYAYQSTAVAGVMREAARIRTTSFNNGTDANHWAIALTGNHAFTDDLSMHYGLAYLALNKPNYRVVKSAGFTGLDIAGDADMTVGSYAVQDKDLGFEVDLGFTFQLLDNLSFTTAFGYMFNGDAFKELKGYNWTVTSSSSGKMDAVWADADDSYVWFNSLTFSF